MSDAVSSEIKECRATTPVTEVAVTRYRENGDECLYIGDIGAESVQFRQRWETEEGEIEHYIYEIVAVVSTPTPMGIDEAVDWVESGPEALAPHVQHELPEDIGEYPGIGMKESYTTEPDPEGWQ